ncbi:MAG: S8 family peptidase [Chloroflexi bacterium]|nr:S8 family peptidase [Chloroflexota bacterium]
MRRPRGQGSLAALLGLALLLGTIAPFALSPAAAQTLAAPPAATLAPDQATPGALSTPGATASSAATPTATPSPTATVAPTATASATADRRSERHGHVDDYVRQKATREPNALIPVLIQRQGGTVALDPEKVRAEGGLVTRQLKTKNAIAAEVPASKLEALAREPGVTRISFDAPVQAQSDSAELDPKDLRTVYPFAVRAPGLWTTAPPIQGTGVTVAVLDSGITTHRDFHGADASGRELSGMRILARVSVAQRNPGGPEDGNGHGTFVAGIIAGRGWSSEGKIVGIAPNANLVSVRVSDADGMARTSDVIAGLEWVVANKDLYRIRVLNISVLSSVAESYTTSLLDAAVELAWLKGIVVVVAAGNGGPNTMLYPPANDPYVITVGATDDMASGSVGDDRLAWFSSYGRTQDGFAKPELVAPGRRIVSTLSSTKDPLALQYPDRVISERYIRLSGTSAAAPVVSGVVAQVLQVRPSLTPDQVKWLLVQTADDLHGRGTGAGYPQSGAAVRYSGTVGRANQGLMPNRYVAMAGYAAMNGSTTVSWDTVSWDTVSWDTVSWDTVSWDTVSWDTVSWDTVSWDTVSWDTVAGD